MNRTPDYGYPVRGSDGVTIGWAWVDPADPGAVHVRDDRWEVTTRHTGPLATCLARVACVARTGTNNAKMAIHLHELIEITADAATVGAEAEVLRKMPTTPATVARAGELRQQVEALIVRRDVLVRACAEVPS